METIQKKTSEARTRANKKYAEKNMKMISVNLNKDVFELLEAGVLKSGINRNKYVTTAIMEKLEKDGFILDDEKEKQMQYKKLCDIVLIMILCDVDNFMWLCG